MRASNFTGRSRGARWAFRVSDNLCRKAPNNAWFHQFPGSFITRQRGLKNQCQSLSKQGKRIAHSCTSAPLCCCQWSCFSSQVWNHISHFSSFREKRWCLKPENVTHIESGMVCSHQNAWWKAADEDCFAGVAGGAVIGFTDAGEGYICWICSTRKFTWELNEDSELSWCSLTCLTLCRRMLSCPCWWIFLSESTEHDQLWPDRAIRPQTILDT